MDTRTMPAQGWDPEQYARTASFVPALGAGVLALFEPRPGERVLDLGCGDGVLTERLVAAGCDVVGVDASPEQIAAARARGLKALVMKGEALTFAGEFDAVFSNAALHWMRDADAVLAGVRRALKPGGRFAAEFGGYGCVAKIREGLPTDIEGWLETFAKSFLAAVDESERASLLKDVRTWLEPHLHGSDGWVADYVRLRFIADAR